MRGVQELIYKPVAFIVRDFKIAASYRLQFVMQGFGVLLTSTIFYMFSRMIGEQKLASLESYGGDYFSFLLVGIALTDYLTISTNGFSNEIRNGQVVGTLESLLVSPTSIITILLSSYVYKLLATSLRILLYILLGIFVFDVSFQVGNVMGLFLTFVLVLLPFIGIGLISAAFIIVFKQGSPVSALLAMSSGLLGGVMYPVEVLPGWLRPFSEILPITHGLEAMRQVLLNGAGVVDIWVELVVLLGFSVVFLAGGDSIGVAKKVAKREGSLLHY